MKKITRTIYMTKESIELIDKDINATDRYVVFSNKEEGTVEIDITLSVVEEFRITEDVLMDIITGLTPALSEKEHENKLNQVLNHLRSIGASL
jgi:hypothetical protein